MEFENITVVDFNNGFNEAISFSCADLSVIVKYNENSGLCGLHSEFKPINLYQ